MYRRLDLHVGLGGLQDSRRLVEEGVACEQREGDDDQRGGHDRLRFQNETMHAACICARLVAKSGGRAALLEQLLWGDRGLVPSPCP